MVLITVLHFSYKRFILCGLEGEVLFENVVIRHTLILILPTSQTQLWDRDLLFTRILFIVQIESGHPENIAFNGRGSCPQTCPETVAQKRRPKHHNGRKNLVNGRSKKKAKMLCFPGSPR